MKRLWFIFFLACSAISQAQVDEDAIVDSLLLSIQEAPNVQYVEQLNDAVVDIYKSMIPKDKERFVLLLKTIVDLAESSDNIQSLAKAHYNMGRFYIANYGGYAKAIPSILHSLSLYEQISDSAGISACYMQMGIIGYITQYFEDAIKNFKLSVLYDDNPTSTYLMAITFSELNNFQESRYHFEKAIKVFKKLVQQQSLNECYMYLGKLHENAGNLDTAYFYLRLGLEGQKHLNDKDGLSRPYALIAGYYLKVNNLDSAKHLAHLSLLQSEVGSDKLSAMLASETLSEVYEREENYTESHKYLKMHYTLKHENVQGSNKQKIAELRSLFDFKKRMAEEKHRHDEEMRRKNRTKNISIYSSLFVLIMAGGLWSRLNYVRKSKAALQKEKNISEGLLLNILPQEIAQELKSKGRAEARNFNQVSILFTDFKCFTEQSEKLSAEELVNEINFCFRAFDEILERYNIEKIKTIGDAYMAVGGLPVPFDSSARNTVLAALDLQAFIVKRKATQDAVDKPAFEMRAGIHTGSVVAGIVGTKKFQYDIWGDAVNTASRMEGSSDVGKVNISQVTYECIKDDPEFKFESRGKVSVKGKGEIDMWFVYRS